MIGGPLDGEDLPAGDFTDDTEATCGAYMIVDA
jgi:hypothetical protein